jgi:hypothetical protein
MKTLLTLLVKMKTLLILLVMLSPIVAAAGDNKEKEAPTATEVVEQYESIRTTEYVIVRFHTKERVPPEETVVPPPLRWSPPVEAHLHYPFLLIKDEKVLDNAPK